jgi:hypothetical protein
MPAALERRLWRVIHAQVTRCGCVTLTVNGMPDHVPLLVKCGREITFARLMNDEPGQRDLLRVPQRPGRPRR